jgi:hypothetical protein
MKNIPSKRGRRIRPEYDFSTGVRAKYTDGYCCGTNVRLLDPELVAAFPDSKSVNDALRMLVAIAARIESREPA